MFFKKMVVLSDDDDDDGYYLWLLFCDIDVNINMCSKVVIEIWMLWW